jgi:hypothetical protein
LLLWSGCGAGFETESSKARAGGGGGGGEVIKGAVTMLTLHYL